MKQRRAKLQERKEVTAEEIDEYFQKVEERLAQVPESVKSMLPCEAVDEFVKENHVHARAHVAGTSEDMSKHDPMREQLENVEHHVGGVTYTCEKCIGSKTQKNNRKV